jgi:hypothetical protein
VNTGKEAERAAKKLELEERRRLKALEKAAAKTGKKRGASAVTASQPSTAIGENDDESGSDVALGRLSEEDEDADTDLMRSMLREEDGDSSGNGSLDDEPATPPPKTRKAPAKPRATATGGRGAAAGKATTTRATRKNKADAMGQGSTGSESEGTKLNREMMAIHESE